MRRMATLLATLALMVVFSSGVTLAAYEDSIMGTDHTDILSGTGKAEQISGLSGGDKLNGADNLIGQAGDTSDDRFNGGGDIVQSRDAPAVKDTVECGPGTVYATSSEATASG